MSFSEIKGSMTYAQSVQEKDTPKNDFPSKSSSVFLSTASQECLYADLAATCRESFKTQNNKIISLDCSPLYFLYRLILKNKNIQFKWYVFGSYALERSKDILAEYLTDAAKNSYSFQKTPADIDLLVVIENNNLTFNNLEEIVKQFFIDILKEANPKLDLGKEDYYIQMIESLTNVNIDALNEQTINIRLGRLDITFSLNATMSSISALDAMIISFNPSDQDSQLTINSKNNCYLYQDIVNIFNEQTITLKEKDKFFDFKAIIKLLKLNIYGLNIVDSEDTSFKNSIKQLSLQNCVAYAKSIEHLIAKEDILPLIFSLFVALNACHEQSDILIEKIWYLLENDLLISDSLFLPLQELFSRKTPFSQFLAALQKSLKSLPNQKVICSYLGDCKKHLLNGFTIFLPENIKSSLGDSSVDVDRFITLFEKDFSLATSEMLKGFWIKEPLQRASILAIAKHRSDYKDLLIDFLSLDFTTDAYERLVEVCQQKDSAVKQALINYYYEFLISDSINKPVIYLQLEALDILSLDVISTLITSTNPLKTWLEVLRDKNDIHSAMIANLLITKHFDELLEDIDWLKKNVKETSTWIVKLSFVQIKELVNTSPFPQKLLLLLRNHDNYINLLKELVKESIQFLSSYTELASYTTTNDSEAQEILLRNFYKYAVKTDDFASILTKFAELKFIPSESALTFKKESLLLDWIIALRKCSNLELAYSIVSNYIPSLSIEELKLLLEALNYKGTYASKIFLLFVEKTLKKIPEKFSLFANLVISGDVNDENLKSSALKFLEFSGVFTNISVACQSYYQTLIKSQQPQKQLELTKKAVNKKIINIHQANEIYFSTLQASKDNQIIFQFILQMSEFTLEQSNFILPYLKKDLDSVTINLLEHCYKHIYVTVKKDLEDLIKAIKDTKLLQALKVSPLLKDLFTTTSPVTPLITAKKIAKSSAKPAKKTAKQTASNQNLALNYVKSQNKKTFFEKHIEQIDEFITSSEALLSFLLSCQDKLDKFMELTITSKYYPLIVGEVYCHQLNKTTDAELRSKVVSYLKNKTIDETTPLELIISCLKLYQTFLAKCGNEYKAETTKLIETTTTLITNLFIQLDTHKNKLDDKQKTIVIDFYAAFLCFKIPEDNSTLPINTFYFIPENVDVNLPKLFFILIEFALAQDDLKYLKLLSYSIQIYSDLLETLDDELFTKAEALVYKLNNNLTVKNIYFSLLITKEFKLKRDVLIHQTDDLIKFYTQQLEKLENLSKEIQKQNLFKLCLYTIHEELEIIFAQNVTENCFSFIGKFLQICMHHKFYTKKPLIITDHLIHHIESSQDTTNIHNFITYFLAILKHNEILIDSFYHTLLERLFVACSSKVELAESCFNLLEYATTNDMTTVQAFTSPIIKITNYYQCLQEISKQIYFWTLNQQFNFPYLKIKPITTSDLFNVFIRVNNCPHLQFAAFLQVFELLLSKSTLDKSMHWLSKHEAIKFQELPKSLMNKILGETTKSYLKQFEKESWSLEIFLEHQLNFLSILIGQRIDFKSSKTALITENNVELIDFSSCSLSKENCSYTSEVFVAFFEIIQTQIMLSKQDRINYFNDKQPEKLNLLEKTCAQLLFSWLRHITIDQGELFNNLSKENKSNYDGLFRSYLFYSDINIMDLKTLISPLEQSLKAFAFHKSNFWDLSIECLAFLENPKTFTLSKLACDFMISCYINNQPALGYIQKRGFDIAFTHFDSVNELTMENKTMFSNTIGTMVVACSSDLTSSKSPITLLDYMVESIKHSKDIYQFFRFSEVIYFSLSHLLRPSSKQIFEDLSPSHKNDFKNKHKLNSVDFYEYLVIKYNEYMKDLLNVFLKLLPESRENYLAFTDRIGNDFSVLSPYINIIYILKTRLPDYFNGSSYQLLSQAIIKHQAYLQNHRKNSQKKSIEDKKLDNRETIEVSCATLLQNKCKLGTFMRH